MAGGKETPRQKMIGMMYLVLMAMLALNVTRQILNAFAVVNQGLTVTNFNYSQKNESTFELFKKAMDQDPKKTKPFYDKAQEAVNLSNTFCKNIDSLKAYLISVTDKTPFDTAKKMTVADIKSPETFDIPTHIMVNDAAAEDGSKGLAHKLKMQIGEYRKQMLKLLVNPKDSIEVNIGLLTPDAYSKAAKMMQTWEVFNFSESPIAAVIVTLTKLQTDVKNAEASVLQKLLASIDSKSYKIDRIEAEVIPKTTYVTLGDSFHAQIFLAASQSTQNPIVTIDSINGRAIDKQNVKVSDGVGEYGEKPGSEGPVIFSGTIGIKDPSTGTIKNYPFRSNYLAAKPSVVVNPTQMDVFYIGVPNPVSVSAAGYANSDLQVNCSGGSISKTSTGYVVNIPVGAKPTFGTAGPFCTISVSGKQPDGSHRSLGPGQQFRIKKVPPPNCYIGNHEGDVHLSKSELRIYPGVHAQMDNFDFNLTFNVTSFDMSVSLNGINSVLHSNSSKFTDEMKKLMFEVGPGSHIIIEDVHVAHDADARVLPSGLNITLN